MKRAEILGECPLPALRLLEVAAVEGDDLPGQVVVSGGNLHGKRCQFLRRAVAACGDLLVVLGAFFCATDYVTSPVLPMGKIIFGIGCGIFTMLIRVYGSYPEGVSFAILLMNAAAPLIEWLTMPRVYGVRIGRHAA